MDGVVLYKGKYGATQQYAYWIGEELDWPVQDMDQMSWQQLRCYDTVILGSATYLGKLLAADWLKLNTPRLADKQLLLFSTGAAAAMQADSLHKVIQGSVPGLFINRSLNFYLPGRLVLNKLSRKDRWILWCKGLVERNPERKLTMQQGVDHMRRENIYALVDRVVLNQVGSLNHIGI